MLRARELWGEPGTAWWEWWLCRRNEQDHEAAQEPLHDVAYRYYLPWLLRHSGLAALIRERFPSYAGRARARLAAGHGGLAPQDFRLMAYEEALDMADWAVDALVERFRGDGDDSAAQWHLALRDAGQRARFEFETLWMYGVKLRALGCERPFWTVSVRECGEQAVELSRRYGEELLATFLRSDQRLRERRGQGMGYCLGLWFVLLQFVEEAAAEPESDLHGLPLLNRVLRYPGWAMWPGCREPLPM
ncbi:hypothetical protein [Segniliparus rugosus]|uniref:Uncharacterized protein n=1 Tax=Segniliparus rugosus (strain ATCC BAA-974 / DSM 45345 / CCUG 50838 / CIP 108380 / JCM 13579 / CDC 945) TaxID=679197 RepID=E5XNY7_SEGRC|nr:hypothetical protein [Segniliparus rugosus]EFV13926.1 hypothetical protein HMPREF9336_01208 [Segniliparus rugosus ATCC BAA-974]